MFLQNFDWTKVHDNNIDMFSDYNMIQNNCIYSFYKQKKVFLFHATTESNYKKIMESNYLKSSGGCLVGSIYCTPIFIDESDRLRVHNLGVYYYFKELPMTMKARNSETSLSKGFVIEIDNPSDNISAMGINYMKFGQLHYNYIQSVARCNIGLSQQIVDNVNEILTKGRSFIKLTQDMYQREITYENSIYYFNEFNKHESLLNFLGYILFEVLSHYIMLNQDDEISRIYKQLNEVYNWNYKDMFFTIYPSLLTKFELEKVIYKNEEITNYIKKRKIISNFNDKEFTVCICQQVINTLCEKIFLNLNISDLYDLPHFFDYNAKLQPLIGNIVYRYVKKNLKGMYSYIERKRAVDIWDFWREQDITLLYNNYISKGEFGINPININNFQYKIYDCNKITNEGNSPLMYVDVGKGTDIRIKPSYIPFEESLNR